MTIIATCGHDITNEDLKKTEIHIMAFTRECKNAVAICAACSSCRKDYEAWGIVLHNQEEERAWLNNEIRYPLP
jgi:hypothetical protein